MRIGGIIWLEEIVENLEQKYAVKQKEVRQVPAKDMARSRSSISKARSYKEIAEFWDTHDLTDYWDQTTPVEFEVSAAK